MEQITKRGVTLLLLLSAILVISCEAPFTPNEQKATNEAIFDEAWEFVDKEYSLFDIKGVNWDSLGSVYRPRAVAATTDEELFDAIADMLFHLRDGHVNLVSDFDVSRNWQWFLDYPTNYNSDLLQRHYFKGEQAYVGSTITYDFGDIGYVYYGSFSSPLTEQDLRYIHEKFKDHKGLILDIRNNGGGFLSTAHMLGGIFVKEPTTVAKSREKNGPGHFDYTPFTDLVIEPFEDDPVYFSQPVALLTNRKCYSAASFFTQFLRPLPQVTIIGDLTGGGGGAPVNTELLNGWSLRVSGTQTHDLSGKQIEHGTPPDIWVDMDPTQLTQDAILDKALEVLRQ